MELQVWKEKQDEKEPVRLRLVEAHDIAGQIDLITVNEKGKRLDAGSLLFITCEGKIRRFSSVDPGLGFALDAKGRIIVEE